MEETTTSTPRRRLERMLGTVIDSKYRIDAFLGRGGMGTVWKAEHLMLHRTVALKLLRNDDDGEVSDETLQRFRREAALASKLRHDNTVMLHDFGVHEGMPYLVMEFLVGESLRARLQHSRQLPVQIAAQLCRQIADGVSEAHAHGILHRDLKPENVMLVKNNHGAERAVVLDFGVAKLLGSADHSGNTLTEQGALIGTPHYMSPEQIKGDAITFASDVYALGIILYEMVAGAVPFKGDSALSVAWQHLNDSPEPLTVALPDSPFSEGIDRVLSRALAKDAKQRFQSPRELSNALDEVVGIQSSAHTTNRSLRILPDQSFGSSDGSLFPSRTVLAGALILIGAGAFAVIELGGTGASPEKTVNEIEASVDAPPAQGATPSATVESPAAQRLNARRLAQAGKNLEAAQLYQSLVEASPDDASLLAEQGAVLIALNQLKEADNALAKAVALSPASTEIRVHYGYVLLLEERFTDAIAELQQVLEVLPEHLTSRENLGRAYLGAGKVDDAIAQFRLALKSDPHLSAAAYQLGEALARKDDLQGAVAAYRNGLKSDSLNAKALAREAELAAALQKRTATAATGMTNSVPSALDRESRSIRRTRESRDAVDDAREDPEESAREDDRPPPPPPHELGDPRYGRPPPHERGGRPPRGRGREGEPDPRRPPPPPPRR